MKKKLSKTQGEKQSKPKIAGYALSSWRPYILILIVGLLAFGKTLFFQYTYHDDNLIILDQTNTLSNLSEIIKSFYTPYLDLYYRPLITISMVLDAQVSGVLPWMYHCSNIVFHLASSCLVFVVLVELQISRRIVLFASALFAVHPLATQSVAWILGRNDSLLLMFILLSFLSLVRFEAVKKNYWIVFHFLFFILALLTKETAIVFPALCLYFLLFFVRCPLLSKKTIFYVAAWSVIVVSWYIVRRIVLINTTEAYSFSSVIPNLRVMVEMFGKMVVPARLSVYPTFDTLPTIIGILFLVVIGILLLIKREFRTHTISFALLWICLFILPTLVVHLSDSVHRCNYLECRAYASLFGFSLLISGVIAYLSDKFSARVLNIASLLVPVFVIISMNYSLNYKDALTHWTSAVTMSPQVAHTHYNLGIVWLMSEKNPQKAAESLSKAANLDPLNFEYFDNLGVAYGEQGRLEEAEAQFVRAIQLRPDHPFPYTNLAQLYSMKRDLRKAEDYLIKAYAIDSTFYKTHEMLTALYRIQKKYDRMLLFAEKLEKGGRQLDPKVIRLRDSLLHN